MDLGNETWKNFKHILVIRDEITHYKFSRYGHHKNLDEAIEFFEIKNLVYYNYVKQPNNPIMRWIDNLSTSECLRFCINTITDLALNLKQLIEKSDKEEYKNVLNLFGAYKRIESKEVKEFLRKNGANPNKDDDFFDEVRNQRSNEIN